MKNLIMVLVIFFSALGSSLAQTSNNLYTSKIDSVQKLLNTHPSDDTIRVKQLNELARTCFFDTQYKRGFIAAKQAQALAEKLNYKKGEGLYYRTMTYSIADYYLNLYCDKKIKWYYRNIQESEEISDLNPTYYPEENIDKLTAQLLEELALFEKEQNKEAIAYWSYGIFLNYYYDLGKAAEALPYLDNAIQNFNDINQIGLAVALRFMKMEVLQKGGKSWEAQESGKDVLLTISKISDKKESAFLTYLLGFYYTKFGKSAQAIENGLKLNNSLEEDDMKDLKASVLSDLGVNFAFLSMSRKAVEYYKNAISLMEEINSTDDAIRINFNLGFELVAL